MLTGIVDPAQLATFAGIWLAAAASPGGNVAFTVAMSSRFGFAAGMTGASGFVTALLIFMVVVGFGLGFAVTQYAPVLNVLRWAGVGYLLYLAYRMWAATAPVQVDAAFEAVSYPKILVQGALICLTNPKAIIFMTVIFPQTVDASRPLGPQLFVLGVCGALCSFVVHAIYSLLGHTLGRSVPTPGARRIVNRTIAAVFVVAAVGLGVANI